MLSKKCHPKHFKRSQWTLLKRGGEAIQPENLLPEDAPGELDYISTGAEQGASDPEAPFYAKTIDQCLKALDSSMNGLTDDEIGTRQKLCGMNLIENDSFQKKRLLFLYQFKNWVVYLLFFAGIASFSIQDYVTGAVIFVAMMLNVLLGFLGTWKSRQKSLDFNVLSNSMASVKRNNRTLQVPASDVVPGDILVISPGQVLCADARLVFSNELRTDESLLTGESDLVVKDARAVLAADTDLSEQSNMLFAGTRARTGHGEALVVSTGADSMVGRIANLANVSEKRDTPMTKSVNKLGLIVLATVFVLTAAIVALEYYRGTPLLNLAPFALILLVAAVPQTLTAVTTFILSLGLERLSQEGVFIKHLQAFEGIGSISVLCTDKTGTLTENTMNIHEVYVPCREITSYDPDWALEQSIPCPSVEALLRVARNCNTTVSDGLRGSIMGDPIDIALHRATPAKYGADYRLVKNYPFRPELRKMARVLKQKDGQMISMIKGAPEEVILQCPYFMKPDGEIVEMDQHTRNELILINREMAIEGAYRVIGLAQKLVCDEAEDPYANAVFVGWISLNDPIKPGVEESIAACKDIGVDVTMITGDQKATAAIIGRKLGIFQEGSLVWTRRELSHDNVLIPKSVRIFARTKPEEKLAIVESLQNSGEVVAMVGDGVNDTPALHKSDISIAMGPQASDEAKKSSDIILLNDRFEGIVAAILESRYLIHNLKLAVEYLLSCNLGLVVLAFAAAVFGMGQPLNAVQMLWLNLVIVTFPALTMAIVPADPEKICEPLTSTDDQIVSKKRLMVVIFWSGLVAIAGILAYGLAQKFLGYSVETASTLAFLTVSFVQALNLLNVQFTHAGGRIWAYLMDALQVPILWLVMILTISLQVFAVYNPAMQFVLDTTVFAPQAWALPVGIALSTFILSMLLVDSEKLN